MKHVCILILAAITFPLIIQAESLCGSSDQVVCLTNSTAIDLSSNHYTYYPGTQVVLLVPGMDINSNLTVSGAPTEPFWFSYPNGAVTDTQGNTWLQTDSLYTDERGDRVIAFEMQTGSIIGAATLQLTNISACQKISDGPRLVLVTIKIFAAGSGKTANLIVSKIIANEEFQECTEYKGHMPTPEFSDQLTVVNPWEEPVLMSLGEQSINLAPHEQRQFDGGNLAVFNSSNKLGLVVRTEETDLNLVTIDSKDNQSYLVPHISNNPSSWENQWRMVAAQDTQLQYLVFGTEIITQAITAGLWSIPIQTEQGQANTWMRFNTSYPTNGFFEFNRIDGIAGGAAVEALRVGLKPFGETILYLTHVASDTSLFWTGFSLVNPNDSAATVTFTGYRANGVMFGESQATLQPGQKMVEVIGQNIFPQSEGLSWIKIKSDAPVAGLELFGGQNAGQPYLAGFLLSADMASRISFPLLDTHEGWWSGLSLLNPSSVETLGTLEFMDTLGLPVSSIPVTLAPMEKQLFLAPEGSTQAIWKGGPCSGFVLIGDEGRQKLGGYLGVNLEP